MFVRVFATLRSAIFMLLIFPALTVVLSLIGICWFALTGKRNVSAWTAIVWASLVLWFLGIKVQYSGEESLPKGGYLLLFSHTSFADIFALAARIWELHFGAKIELFSIPIFGLAMRAAGFLPIARQNRSGAIRVLQEAENRARNGEKFALSPEGGRNQTEVLLPFKSGPFIFAINAGVPVVPVVIRGAARAWPKGALFPCCLQWTNPMEVKFLPPISTANFTVEKRAELSQLVRVQMAPYFALNHYAEASVEQEST